MIKDYQTYLFRYRFEDAEYGFEIVARSKAEAKRRLSAMGLAQYEGVLAMRIPHHLGWVAKVSIFLRNLFSNKENA